MLKLTGFPLPDVGILTLTAMAGKSRPEDVTLDDLNEAAKYLEDFYTKGIGKKLIKRLFPNSGWDQPSWDLPKFEHKRKAWADLVLRGHQHQDLEPILKALEKEEYRAMVLRDLPDAPLCDFTGLPSYLRVRKTMFPLLNAHDVFNFSPAGNAGLPVSDVILLAIHAMPLGSISSQGQILVVDSSNPALMFSIVQRNLDDNRRFYSLANMNEYDGYMNVSNFKTRLIDRLVKIQRNPIVTIDSDRGFPSITAYHFTNDNQASEIDIYQLPSSTVQFVWEAGKDNHAAIWQRIVQNGWTEEKSENEEVRQKKPKLTQRNLIYEDLFGLPEKASEFLRTYFLRQSLQGFKNDKNDPRRKYDSLRESDLISWDLTALFLKRIMNMEKSRIDSIRDLGDQLAEYIQQYNHKLLRSLYKGGGYREFRIVLLRAIQDYALHAPTGSEPLVPFNSFVKIFEEGDGFEKLDWNLARDLLLIRIFEVLHRSGYLSKAVDDLQDEEPDEADTD